jgi:hypothetical protein
MKHRIGKTGRPPILNFNPFQGLLFDAQTQTKLYVNCAGGSNYSHLVSLAAMEKREGVKWVTFPLKVLVEALLSQLRELEASGSLHPLRRPRSGKGNHPQRQVGRGREAARRGHRQVGRGPRK